MILIFWGELFALPWNPPSPLGQKRKYLERNVETYPDRIDQRNTHAGTGSPIKPGSDV